MILINVIMIIIILNKKNLDVTAMRARAQCKLITPF